MFSMSSRVRRARALASLSQTELARRVGVKRSAVTQWEAQKGTMPSVEHLVQIACETSVCFEWLATGRGPCRPEAGDFDTAVILQDYASDDLESRVLIGLRRLSGRRKEAAAIIIELLGN